MRPSSGSRSPQWAGHYGSKDITTWAADEPKSLRKCVHSPAGCSEPRGVRCSTSALHRRAAPAHAHGARATSTRRRCAARPDARLVPRPRARAPLPRGSSCGLPAEGQAWRSWNGHPAARAGGRRLGAGAVKNNGGSSRQTRDACRHEAFAKQRPTRSNLTDREIFVHW